jgi:hypothetical protein
MRRPTRSIVAAIVLVGGAVAASVLPGQSNPGIDASTLNPFFTAESTSLYCAGISPSGVAGSGGAKFWNSSNERRHLDIEMTNDNRAVASTATIGPKESFFLPAGSTLDGSISVRAQIDGPGVVGSLFTTGPDSTSIPCQSDGVTDWYVTGLGTAGGASSRLTLLNPTATPAVIDITTQSSLGFSAPASYQGLVIPANGQLTLSVGQEVVEATALAVHVRALRGSFVGSALLVVGNRASILTGQAYPMVDSSYGSVNTNENSTESINLYNPLDVTAHVKLKLYLPGFDIAPIAIDVEPSATIGVTLVPDTRVPTSGWATLRVTSPEGIISTLYSAANGYARLASPTPSGTTLAWLSALDHNGPVRVLVLQGQNVPVTFTYFKGQRAISTTLKASAGIPVTAPEEWLSATYGIVSAGTPLLMQGAVGASGLESGLNGR